MIQRIHELCLTHFLCEFDPKSRKRKTRDIVSEVALKCYAPELVNQFIDLHLDKFQNVLVDEFNARYSNHSPLRFQIVDTSGVGAWIQGYRAARSVNEIKFQDALNAIAPAEFEKLAAIVLRIIGCYEVFFTPESHDQGLDAFGHQQLLSPTPYGMIHKLTWIAQAKHFLRTTVTSSDVRELIGSKELLLAKVFSTVDERYKELRLRPYAPTAIALITTEEIPSTVRRLAEGSGIFVFAASDIFHLLSGVLTGHNIASIRRLIKKDSKSIQTLL